MKYFSEILNKKFDSSEECLEAERKHLEEIEEKEKKEKELAKAKKAREKELEEAYDAKIEAARKYENLLSAFLDDYGKVSFKRKYEPMDIDKFFSLL